MPTPDFSPKLPVKMIQFPPKKGENATEVQMICPDDNRGGCGYAATGTFTDSPRVSAEDKHTCVCPKCGEFMVLYWGQYMTFGIKMKGPGFSETKCGMRMKRDREWRSKVLASSQWDNHQPITPTGDPGKIRNATPGGPLDPNSKFNKGKKKKRQIFT